MSTRVQVILDSHEKAAFQTAAKQQGVSLSSWLKSCANKTLEEQKKLRRLDSKEELRAFFEACDAQEQGVEQRLGSERRRQPDHAVDVPGLVRGRLGRRFVPGRARPDRHRGRCRQARQRRLAGRARRAVPEVGQVGAQGDEDHFRPEPAPGTCGETVRRLPSRDVSSLPETVAGGKQNR